MSYKDTVLEKLSNGDDECSIQAALDRLLLIEAIEEGCAQYDAGDFLTHEEMLERIARWLK